MGKRRGDAFEDSDEFLEIQQKLGRKLRALRMARKLTMKELATLAEASAANYAIIEAGAGNASLLILARVSKALGVPIAKFFEESSGSQVAPGMDAMMSRLLAELDKVRRHMDVRSDELGRVTQELQGFLDLNREALEDSAATGDFSRKAISDKT